MIEHFHGHVQKIRYQDPKRGCVVMEFQLTDSKEVIPVFGNFSGVAKGVCLNIEGYWQTYNQKKQFKATRSEVILPKMPEVIVQDEYTGLRKYLESKKFPGIGSIFADRIVTHFGESTIDVIENYPLRLKEIPGLSADAIQSIPYVWKENTAINRAMIFLLNYCITANLAEKVCKQYKPNTIVLMKANPYRIIDDIPGVGFETADRLALSMGIESTSIFRCCSGVQYALHLLSKKGHVYGTHYQIMKAAEELLGVEEPFIEDALVALIASSRLIQDGQAIYLNKYYSEEMGVAEKITELMKEPAGKYCRDNIPIHEIEKELGIQYDETQAEAIQQACASRVMVITGGPGTGKTTLVRGILCAMQMNGLEVRLAAPTGRASKRMMEATNNAASTIHRLLGITLEKGPLQDKGPIQDKVESLPGDVLIVDECSMIDISLMYALLQAVPAEMQLILVGDIDQLPSVGPGNVLRDIIESGCVPVIRLTKIYRQENVSSIVTNAHRINEGKMPFLDNRASDFTFVEESDPEKVADKVISTFKELVDSGEYTPSDIQVLCPMRRSPIGSTELNVRLQEAINPKGTPVILGDLEFRESDRVMQIRNNYDKVVFNGEVGRAGMPDDEARVLQVIFDDRIIDYMYDELNELTLSYASTIHKSQGSEYPVVIIPLLMNCRIMLQRNLLYTAVTRAKERIIIIGTEDAVQYAVNRTTVDRRNTMLSSRIQDCYLGD